jgi:hypothetical protein
MIALLLLFDNPTPVSTGDALATAFSAAFGVGMVLFFILFWFILWFDTRQDKKNWELRDLIYKETREVRDLIYKEARELRDMIWKAEHDFRHTAADNERRSRDALDSLRKELKSRPEGESLDAQWALLLAESRERAERARERLKRRRQPQPPTNAEVDQPATPENDLDEGLKRLEQTITNLTPTDNEALQRADASLKRILENLKSIREIQKGTDALLEGE